MYFFIKILLKVLSSSRYKLLTQWESKYWPFFGSFCSFGHYSSALKLANALPPFSLIHQPFDSSQMATSDTCESISTTLSGSEQTPTHTEGEQAENLAFKAQRYQVQTTEMRDSTFESIQYAPILQENSANYLLDLQSKKSLLLDKSIHNNGALKLEAIDDSMSVPYFSGWNLDCILSQAFAFISHLVNDLLDSMAELAKYSNHIGL